VTTQDERRPRFDFRERIQGRRPDDDPVIRLEIYGILVLAFAIALLLGILTFDPADLLSTGVPRARPVANLIGPVGAQVANSFLSLLGLGSFAVVATFGALGLSYIVGRRSSLTGMDVLGWLGLLLSGTVLLHIALPHTHFYGHVPGGLLGEYAGEILRAFLSTAGTLILSFALFIVSLITLTRRSIFELAVLVARAGLATSQWVRRLLTRGDALPEQGSGREAIETNGDTATEADTGTATEAHTETATEAVTHTATNTETDTEAATEAADAPATTADTAPDTEAATEAAAETATDTEPPTTAIADAETACETATVAALADAETAGETATVAGTETAGETGSITDREIAGEAESGPGAALADKEPARQGAAAESTSPVQPPGPLAALVDDPHDGQIKIVESPAMRRGGELIVGEQLPLEPEVGVFELPSLSLLHYEPPVGKTYDTERLTAGARILEQKLADFKIKGHVVEIHPGPVVTMYEFRPAPGVKVSSIANRASDLAMALAALRIRIVAPIPGKNAVGIEVPNETREIVWLKEILADPSYTKSKSKLTLALGKDIVGNPAVMNLAKAPHLLVAGATGSGKSVAVNSFIISLLYNATPKEVRLIMVDPKILELSIYEGIPHLLLPVVTDPKQATIALRWAVREMDRRYRLMADVGVRGLADYNAKVRDLLADPDPTLPEPLKLARAKREAKGVSDPEGVLLDSFGDPIEELPFIVIIIDELADLMMVASKDVEMSIARLAQKARASGIHLILATQRPSVNVITGLIKANFPTRIGFRVASAVDSRTILDQKGAENLLGLGDMLYLGPGAATVQRVHGSLVTDDEVHRVVEHLKSQGGPDYNLGILTAEEDAAEEGTSSVSDEHDELYDRAVRIVAETRNASISFLQRKLKIGYNRSARIVERLEEEGVIGPSDGTSRPRQVFIDPL